MFAMFEVEDGEINVRLDENLRALLTKVSEELRELLLVDEGEQLTRLYPPAHPDDDELQSEFKEMVHDQLLMQRLDGIDQLQQSVNDETISVELADTWMAIINQARLVLGTQLDVSEEDGPVAEDDPDLQGRVVYQVLSHILEDLTTARMWFL